VRVPGVGRRLGMDSVDAAMMSRRIFCSMRSPARRQVRADVPRPDTSIGIVSLPILSKKFASFKNGARWIMSLHLDALTRWLPNCSIA